MFMKDFTKAATEFVLVQPRLPAVTPSHVVTGIVAGTLVEATNGWRAIETLRIGDAIQTLDGGLARILGLDRRSLTPSAETALIHVPGGCHDACSDILLVPGQHLLMDTLGDTACDGAPFVLLPAIALTSDAFARRHFPQVPVEVITPLFADEEVIYANSGVLLHCPGIVDGAGRYPDTSFFPRLDAATARAFLQRRAARLVA